MEERLREVLPDILGGILRFSKDTAIVDVSGLGLNQQEVAMMLPSYYSPMVALVQEILKKGALFDVPGDKATLVVTDYSDRFYRGDKTEEVLIENVIRALVENRSAAGGKLTILVLSETLPHPDIFSNSSMPWYNGPFQDDAAIWALRVEGSKLVRYQYEREYGQRTMKHPFGQKSWKVQRRTVIDL